MSEVAEIAGRWGDEFMHFATKDGALQRAWSRWRRKWGIFASRRQAFEDGFETGARAALMTIHEVRAHLANDRREG